ncbi:metal-dependent transcriptional regulator [Bacillus sp. T33-2]|uniref:metal-dependent transcriptional regulator n=1 Tax=Bacillus sp. T33-2 TaxID=2054168 RepID=UPI000C774D8D|nr:iron dependent repressor, metal binding and dimerization domain protein [Bacillus sp. T33-2]PLR95523.1 transcriptional regulator MntR [Bacillus sp. T33-2]
MASPSAEKYLEEIYNILQDREFTSVTEIARSLNVSLSSVTKMVQKLNKEKYLHYQRYGKIRMTEKGKAKGKELALNHKILEEFFRLIDLEAEQIDREITNIEYYISGNAVSKIKNFIKKEKGQ